jgi:hypothetical protein
MDVKILGNTKARLHPNNYSALVLPTLSGKNLGNSKKPLAVESSAG